MEPCAQLVEIDQRLAAVYGEPRPASQDPLELLVRMILSQNTSDRNRDLAYDALRRCCSTWEKALDAPVDELAEAIRGAGLHHQRARRIQDVLSRIRERQGRLELAFLNDMSPEDAESWLLSLPGVGRKTAYIVLLMALGVPRFPVDTHITRVSKRLGLLQDGVEPHQGLAPLVPATRELALHLNLIRLGREVCTARRAYCARCPLADLCAYARANAAGAPAPREQRRKDEPRRSAQARSIQSAQ